MGKMENELYELSESEGSKMIKPVFVTAECRKCWRESTWIQKKHEPLGRCQCGGGYQAVSFADIPDNGPGRDE